VSNGRVTRSNYTLSGRTLKAKPVASSLDVTLTPEGYYDLKLNMVSDADNAVSEYVFDIYDGNNNLVRSLTSTKNQVNWYYSGDIASSGSYTVRASVRYADNEKVNLMTGAEKSLSVNAPDKAAVGFERLTRSSSVSSGQAQPAYYVNSRGDTIAVASEVEATNASRIWGELLLYPNGVKITGNTYIVVTSNDDVGYYNKIPFTLPQTVPTGNEPYYIPVKCMGLKADTAYLFSIYGNTEKTIQTGSGNGATTQMPVTDELLGSVVVSTNKLTEASRQDPDHPMAAAFILTPAVSETAGTIAAIQFKIPGDGKFTSINSTDPTSAFYYERATARAIEFTLYSQDGSVLGTVVKDLYGEENTPWYRYRTQADAEKDGVKMEIFDQPNDLPEAERMFYTGPLVAGDWSSPIYLTKNDFKTSSVGMSFDIEEFYGKFVLEATALYDYSYHMLGDAYPSYSENFLNQSIQNYNRISLGKIEVAPEEYLNQTTVDMGVRPPELIDPPNEAVTVTELKNTSLGENVILDSLDSNLLTDTTVGLKVQSNYRNHNKDTLDITYYAMTLDTWQNYDYLNNDIIQDYKNKKAGANILFEITVPCLTQYPVESGVPALYVIITENEKLLNKCRKDTGEKDSNGNPVYSYHIDESNKNYPVFYTNLVPRGDTYVFAFTLRSYYGVDTSTSKGDEELAWEFPTKLPEVVHTNYFPDQVQRSHGTTVYKEQPRVACYLDHTVIKGVGGAADDAAVWTYYIYDPDEAMKKDGGKPVFYAGKEQDIRQQLSQSVGVTTTPSYELLTVDVKEEQVIKSVSAPTGTAMATEEYTVVHDSFELGNSGWKDGTLRKYTVTVKDSPGPDIVQHLKAFSSEGYQISLEVRQFTGKHVFDEKNRKAVELLKTMADDTGKILASQQYFGVPTVTQRFDYLNGKMDDLQVAVGTRQGSTELVLSLEAKNGVQMSESAQKHVAAFYYELYHWDDATKKTGNLLQWGVLPYTGASVSLPMSEPEENEMIYVSVRIIYDTGLAGLNLDKITSEVGEIRYFVGKGNGTEAEERKKAVELTGNYYLLQKQNGPEYATEVSNGYIRYNSTGWTGGVLYRSGTNTVIGESGYSRVDTVLRPITDSGTRTLRLQYGLNGAVHFDETIPVYKQLDEVQATLVKAGNSAGEVTIEKDSAGNATGAVVRVPATIPNIITGAASRTYRGANFTFALESKSNRLMAQGLSGAGGGVYGDKIYFELYEYTDVKDGVPVLGAPLDNTDNRYFDLKNNEDDQEKDKDGKLVPKYDNAVDASDGKKACIVVTNDPNDSKTNEYRLAVRNLETGKNYCLKMYCKDKDGKKVYIRDHRTGHNGEELMIQFTPLVSIRIGQTAGNASSKSLTAVYSQTKYDSKDVSLSYTIHSGEKYYVEYSILTEGGTTLFTMDELMKILGYPKEIDSAYSYYDYDLKKWSINFFTRYATADESSYFNPCVSMSNKTFQFTEADMDKLLPGRYRFQVKIFDLSGRELPYLIDDSAVTTSIAPETWFTVPERYSPAYSIAVFQQNDPNDPAKTQFSIGLTVYDNGFYLSAAPIGGNPDTQRKDGKYKVVMVKQKGGQEEEIPLTGSGPGYTITAPSNVPKVGADGLFTTGVSYQITYPAEVGVQYELRIVGHSDEKPSEPGEKILETTDNDEKLKKDLMISDASQPKLGGVTYDFDSTAQCLYIRVIKNLSVNVDRIDKISVTLRDAQTFASCSQVWPANFKDDESDDRFYVVEIPLADAISTMNPPPVPGRYLLFGVEYKNRGGMTLSELNDKFTKPFGN